ncbi:hypothetical protein CDQ80_02100 [Campylobacter hyointestinalis subsp. hyointestinalis]|nr:hypothetical protein CDQ80_02100 [Campylobacter hyointestinalis subsp. hyointestinalis]PPB76977.1 hypothetical protein CDQ81_03910 [Campylobacter hyointestinalis subsp. hyointestinalis]
MKPDHFPTNCRKVNSTLIAKANLNANCVEVYLYNLHYEKFQDGTVKCIEDEIPFAIPTSWSWVRLACLVSKEIKRGKAPKYSEEATNVKVFAQKCNLKAGGINLELAKYLDESALHRYLSTEFLTQGDVIINSTGTGTLGRVGIISDEVEPIVADSHITVVRTSPLISSHYVYCVLKESQPVLEDSGEGSTNQKELRPGTLIYFLVPLPPLSEQNRIAKKTNELFEFIDTVNGKISDLSVSIDSIKSKILDLAIRGKIVPQNPNDEPASVLLERIRAEKEELIKQGKIKRDKNESVIYKGDDNSYYKDLPDNWSVSSLSEITTNSILNDGDWILSNNMDPSGEIKLIQLGSVGFLEYVNKGFKYLTPKIFNDLGCTEIHSGYMLINRIVSDKMCACILPRIEGKKITTVDTCWIAPKDNWYILKYILYAISSPSFQSFVMLNSSGTTRKRISKSNLVNLPLVFPPLAEQKRIVKAIEVAFTQLDKIITTIS